MQPVIAAVKRLIPWTLPAKLLLTGVVGSLAGGGILRFLLEHSAHAYALTYGFRPPVEGVTYLNAAVSFASVALLLLGSIVVSTIVLAFQAFLQVDKLEGQPTLFDRFRRLSLLKAILVVSTISAPFGLLYTFIRTRLGSDPYCSWPLLLCGPKPEFSTEWLLGIYVINLAIGLVFWRPALLWLASALALLVYYIAVGASVLPSHQYARLLRTTGFGGGIPITLELTPRSESESVQVVPGHLLLQTTATYVLYLEPQNLVVEYPISRVLRVTYATGGLHKLPSLLPAPVALTQ